MTMTTTDPIIIPRSELPHTVVSMTCDTPPVISVLNRGKLQYQISQSTAAAVRAAAYEQLAIAEGIDKILADNAKAEDEKKLNQEGLTLYNALHGEKNEAWGSNDDYAKKHWMNVARAARELHGK